MAYHGKDRVIGTALVIGDICPICGRKLRFISHIKGGGKRFICYQCEISVTTNPKMGIPGTDPYSRMAKSRTPVQGTSDKDQHPTTKDGDQECKAEGRPASAEGVDHAR